MEKVISKIKEGFKAFMLSYNEYAPMVLAMVLWWFSSILTRWLDPTAAVDDAGLIQALLFGMVLYFTAQASAWFSMRMAFPKIGDFLDNKIATFYDELNSTQRIYIAVGLFAVHFIGAVIIFANVV